MSSFSFYDYALDPNAGFMEFYKEHQRSVFIQLNLVRSDRKVFEDLRHVSNGSPGQVTESPQIIAQPPEILQVSNIPSVVEQVSEHPQGRYDTSQLIVQACVSPTATEPVQNEDAVIKTPNTLDRSLSLSPATIKETLCWCTLYLLPLDNTDCRSFECPYLHDRHQEAPHKKGTDPPAHFLARMIRNEQETERRTNQVQNKKRKATGIREARKSSPLFNDRGISTTDNRNKRRRSNSSSNPAYFNESSPPSVDEYYRQTRPGD